MVTKALYIPLVPVYVKAHNRSVSAAVALGR